MLGLEPGVPLLTVGRLWQLVTCISSLAPCPVHVHHPPIRLTVLPPPVAQVSRGSPPRVATRVTPSQTPCMARLLHGIPSCYHVLSPPPPPPLCLYSIFFQRSGYSAACFRRHHVTRWNSCTDDMISCGLCPSKCESPPPCAVFAVCCLLFKQTRDVRRLLSDSLALLLFATSSVRP